MEAEALEPANLSLEMAEVLAGAPVMGAGEQKGLGLARTAAGREGGLPQCHHHRLSRPGARHLHMPGASEQPGFGFLLIPR